MREAINTALGYTLLPIFALALTGIFTSVRPISRLWISKFQHFASGVIVSSVALELLPVSLESGSTIALFLGYVGGVAVMLAIDHYAEKTATNFPIAIDLFIDGLLLMIGFAAGSKGGMLLLLGLSLETTALGMAIGPTLGGRQAMIRKVIPTLMIFALSMLAGAGCGLLLPGETGPWFGGIIGFGIAALLFLVVEDLIVEAHETKDTPFTTALFFVGFLVPLVLAKINP